MDENTYSEAKGRGVHVANKKKLPEETLLQIFT